MNENDYFEKVREHLQDYPDVLTLPLYDLDENGHLGPVEQEGNHESGSDG